MIGKMLNEQEAANIKDYVVFDLETTGLSPDYNEIINIGGLLVQNGVVTQEFNTLVKPRKAIPQEIIQLTGITNEAVQNAPSINVALKSFLEAIGDDTVVLGHNLGFDCRFVSAKKKQVYRSSRAEFTNPYIDTLPLAKNVSENIDLSKAVVNGVEIHLNDDISLADFVKTMKLNVALGGSVCDYSFLYFNGNMYEDESEAEDKTLISIEVVDKDGKLIPANDQRKADADKYLVKGFKTSDFFTKEDDYVVEFCEGIHVGMSKEEIIALLGDGKEIEDIGNNFTAYSNGTNTLVIRYAKNDTGYAADDIMLLKN